MDHFKSVLGLTFVCLIFLLLCPAMLIAQSPSEYEYLFLNTTKTSTMQKELQNAAARGYVLVPGQGGWRLSAILEKATGTTVPVEYLLLATSKTKTMQKEMDEAAAKGYRFASVLSSGGSEIVIAMQREQGQTHRTHEERVLATTRTGTMEKELAAAGKDGFRFVGQAELKRMFGEEKVAIMERPVQDKTEPNAGEEPVSPSTK